MSILYDDDQLAIARETRRVLEARHDRAQALALLDTTGAFDERFWETAVAQGWTAMAVPEEFGGLGLGLVELGLVAEQVGRDCPGVPFLASGHAIGRALLGGGDAAVRRRWLPALADGAVLGALALAEGAEPLPAVPEVRFEDGVLTGTKPGVPGGLAAGIAVVWASAADGPVLVLAELAGASRTALDTFDNGRLYADLHFDLVPATVLACGEAARVLAGEVLAQFAFVTACEQVGGAAALLEATCAYALQRRAFGQPIAAFQSVKHRLAELYGLIEIARANAIDAAALDGTPGFLEATACARLSATQAYDTAARDGIQIHGGIGVTWESGLHLHMRRARSLAIEAGNTAFWEDLLAGLVVARGEAA